MRQIHKGYVIGGIVCIVGFSAQTTIGVKADDVLTGNTTIDAQVTKGDLVIGMDATTDFGQKPLGNKVDFGTKEIAFTITDFTGSTKGYQITAQLADTDKKRSLKVGGVELSEMAATVLTKDSNVIGENKDKVAAQLVYTNLTEMKVYKTIVKWQLTNTASKDISE